MNKRIERICHPATSYAPPNSLLLICTKKITAPRPFPRVKCTPPLSILRLSTYFSNYLIQTYSSMRCTLHSLYSSLKPCKSSYWMDETIQNRKYHVTGTVVCFSCVPWPIPFKKNSFKWRSDYLCERLLNILKMTSMPSLPQVSSLQLLP